MSERGRGSASLGKSRSNTVLIAAAYAVIGGAARATLTSGRGKSSSIGPARCSVGTTYQGEAEGRMMADVSSSATVIIWRPSAPTRHPNSPRRAGPKAIGGEARSCHRHRPVASIRRIARSAISGSSDSCNSELQPEPRNSRMIARSTGVR